MRRLGIYTAQQGLETIEMIKQWASSSRVEVDIITSLESLKSWVRSVQDIDAFLLMRQTGLDYKDDDLKWALTLRSGGRLSIINPPQKVLELRGKDRQALFFSRHALPHPPTLNIFELDFEDGARLHEFIQDSAHSSFVLKPHRSLKGLGSVVLDSKRSALSLVEGLGLWSDRRFVLQPLLSYQAEWRILCVGEQKLWALKKPAPIEMSLHWRNNFARLSTQINSDDPPPEITLLAQTIMKLSGLSYAGIDLLQTAQGPVVLEVNPAPGLVGLKNNAKSILDHLFSIV
jgi:glutathione synthase/RimK-type ligase-like ATP-grasp enzyme